MGEITSDMILNLTNEIIKLILKEFITYLDKKNIENRHNPFYKQKNIHGNSFKDFRQIALSSCILKNKNSLKPDQKNSRTNRISKKRMSVRLSQHCNTIYK